MKKVKVENCDEVPEGSFFFRMDDDSMLDAGINDNDLVLVRTGVEATEGSIVLAMVRENIFIRRVFMDKGNTILMADNVNYPSILIDQHEQFEICGVVEKR